MEALKHTEEHDEDLKGSLMGRERCWKCDDESWITPALNLAQSRISPAEGERKEKRRKEVKSATD